MADLHTMLCVKCLEWRHQCRCAKLEEVAMPGPPPEHQSWRQIEVSPEVSVWVDSGNEVNIEVGEEDREGYLDTRTAMLDEEQVETLIRKLRLARRYARVRRRARARIIDK